MNFSLSLSVSFLSSLIHSASLIIFLILRFVCSWHSCNIHTITIIIRIPISSFFTKIILNMATSNLSTRCFTCKEKTTIYSCPGCENHFCVDDLIKHRQELKSQFHQIEHQRNEFVQMLNDQQKTIPNNHPAIIQINLWEQKSIEKIKQTAEEQRQLVQQSIHECLLQIQTQFDDFTQQIQQINKKKILMKAF